MKNKKGFTLLELLAVIVILAIIALIAVPVILNIIDKANKSAFKDTAYGVISAAELYFAEQQLNVNGMQADTTFRFPDGAAGLELKGQEPNSGTVTVTTEGKVGIAIENGRYCITKGYDDTDITLKEGTENCVIPVKITNLILSQTSVSVKEGATATVTATFEPSTATNTALTWTTSNASVATVTNGIITGVAGGEAIITATTTDGSNISKNINVTVVGVKKLSQVAVESDTLGITDVADCATDGTTCAAGTAFAIQLNETTTEKFYVISDDGRTIKLLLNKNLSLEGTTGYSGTDIIAWINEADYEAAGGQHWPAPGATKPLDMNAYGPITALRALKEATSSWTKLDEYSYELNYGTVSDYEGNAFEGKYSGEYVQNVRARLLSYNDLLSSSTGCSMRHDDMYDYDYIDCPSWFMENVNDMLGGYWLSDVSYSDYNNSNHYNAWIAHPEGVGFNQDNKLGYASDQSAVEGGYYMYYSGQYSFWEWYNHIIGLRPVITLAK